jgi:protein-disulfide isomerase
METAGTAPTGHRVKTAYVIVAAAASLALSMGALWFALAPKSATSNANPAGAPVSNTAALQREHAATVGKADAKVHIVEFLDPACETCRDFYPLVKRLVASNPDRVRLSVRMVAFHKGSDFVVKALEASKKQGKYWQVLERLLASQSVWAVQHTVNTAKAWEQLEPLGLDLDKLKADMESPDVLKALALDAQDAKALKVTQTPEYFVNGRGLPEFGWEQLQRLVADELANAYRS